MYFRFLGFLAFWGLGKQDSALHSLVHSFTFSVVIVIMIIIILLLTSIIISIIIRTARIRLIIGPYNNLI